MITLDLCKFYPTFIHTQQGREHLRQAKPKYFAWFPFVSIFQNCNSDKSFESNVFQKKVEQCLALEQLEWPLFEC